MNISHFTKSILVLAAIVMPACDADESFRSSERDRDDDTYVCYAEFDATGEVIDMYCPGEPEGALLGGSCYGELMCCDVVTLGCFCADTEHGAVCPSGTVAAPGPDD